MMKTVSIILVGFMFYIIACAQQGTPRTGGGEGGTAPPGYKSKCINIRGTLASLHAVEIFRGYQILMNCFPEFRSHRLKAALGYLMRNIRHGNDWHSLYYEAAKVEKEAVQAISDDCSVLEKMEEVLGKLDKREIAKMYFEVAKAKSLMKNRRFRGYLMRFTQELGNKHLSSIKFLKLASSFQMYLASYLKRYPMYMKDFYNSKGLPSKLFIGYFNLAAMHVSEVVRSEIDKATTSPMMTYSSTPMMTYSSSTMMTYSSSPMMSNATSQPMEISSSAAPPVPGGSSNSTSSDPNSMSTDDQSTDAPPSSAGV